MKEIVEQLRDQAYHIKHMIGTTAPSGWLEHHTQKEWDKKERERMKMLFKAARILEATL